MKYKIIFTISLLIFTIYLLLDTFLISEVYEIVENTANEVTKEITGKIVSTDTEYNDKNINITLKTYEENDTSIYVADIIVNDSSYLKTAFANNQYGKNITAKTSQIAENMNAILAINGDYYGVQEKGYVLKNGIIYREISVSGKEDLVIYEDGTFEIINESDVTLEELKEEGAYNVLSFGPALIENGIISVEVNDEVDKAMTSNPRTAIGIIDDNHYVFVVSDGRTSESEGLTLYELAQFMKDLGCETAYNLDGGGSSAMYFNGNLVNKPTTSGNKIKERSVSDIVYIGY